MKRLNLSFGNSAMLTKEEMKKIVGGKEVVCTWTNTCSGKTTTSTCGSSPEDCQWGADLICDNGACCGNVDCQ